MNAFVARERERQIAARKQGLTPVSGTAPGLARGRRYPFVLPRDCWDENLDPALRDQAKAYFKRHKIAWHTMAHHMLSSQVCCINHLMPFARQPAALAALLEPLFGPGLEMLPICNDGVKNDKWFVGFEYAGQPGCDYLNEGGGKSLTRGANCTSCDAVVRFRRGDRIETVLIEWKYTESYGAHGARKGDETREGRYRHLLEAEDGPLRGDVRLSFGSFLVDPFYQFMRQQLLAIEMQRFRDMDSDIVRVLHLAPRANLAFRSIPVPAFRSFGDTATGAWASVLAQPDRFVSVAIEDVFGTQAHPLAREHLGYARARYMFTSDEAFRL